jgi:16S rRNA (uracil1498-N3)-methyltransferase
MADRYYVATPIASNDIKLEGDEAHHLIHVLRAKPGAEVVVFDGSGAEFTARVERVERAAAALVVLERREVLREGPRQITLAVALPKGDRQKWLVEKAVELGVTRLVPLETTRGVAQPTDSALKRLARFGIEAAKQCGRTRLLEIGEAEPLERYLEREMAPVRLLAHPSGGAVTAGSPWSRAGAVAVAIGPEGGFTEAEVAAALAAGWQGLDLGPRILRIETAALAVVAALQLTTEGVSP